MYLHRQKRTLVRLRQSLAAGVLYTGRLIYVITLHTINAGRAEEDRFYEVNKTSAVSLRDTDMGVVWVPSRLGLVVVV